VVNNEGQYKVHSEIHSTNTRQISNLHLPSSNLAYYYGIKVFNKLPSHIKDLSDNTKQFKSALKSFLHTNYIYSLEYFNVNKEWKFMVYYANSSLWTNLSLF
jgi:hypothetical protein